MTDSNVTTNDPTMLADIASRSRAGGRVEEAVYLPRVRLEAGTIAGFEARIDARGSHGDLATRVDVSRSHWLVGEACRQLARWQDAIPDAPPIRMSVGLSGWELAPRDFVGHVARLLQDAGIDPSALCLEISIPTLPTDRGGVLAALVALRGLGVAIGLDHVGTDDSGLDDSGLDDLGHLPVDSVKVHPSLIDGVVHRADDVAIVAAVVAMAHEIGLTVVADGVENPDQLRVLEQLGCDEAQGSYFARPHPAGVVTALLRRPLRWRPHGQSRLAG